MSSDLRIGGSSDVVVIAGPCGVEGRDMILNTAAAVRSAGATALRGGAFKPRTSPYSFQGMGQEALELLAEARATTGLPVVTEVVDVRELENTCAYVDVIQIGARNMQNFSLLAEAGRCNKPVLLKRGMSSTLKEMLAAAEYIVAGGNDAVILCERGIRTFDNGTRFTLDVSAVPLLQMESHLPVIVDPSHAAGRADLVASLALAAVAIGADGLIVEVHPDPSTARSDGPQSLNFEQFEELMERVTPVAAAIGRRMNLGPAVAGIESASASGWRGREVA